MSTEWKYNPGRSERIGSWRFFSQLFLDGGTLQNNGTGLFVINGASAKATNVTIQNNSTGIEIRAQSFVNTAAAITANTGTGVFVHESGMLPARDARLPVTETSG